MVSRVTGWVFVFLGLAGMVMTLEMRVLLVACVVFFTGAMMAAMGELSALLGQFLAAHLPAAPQPPQSSAEPRETIAMNETLAG